MGAEEKIEKEKIFKIDNQTVEETQHWAIDVAQIDIDHLRSCIVAGGELCDYCLSLSAYYEKNLAECRILIKEGKGDPIINERRLLLLEIGERTNNLSGYLALLQMDAMMSLVNMLEAKSDVERLLTCKHAYTIIHDAKIKGLFKVVSRSDDRTHDRIFVWDQPITRHAWPLLVIAGLTGNPTRRHARLWCDFLIFPRIHWILLK